MEQGALTENFRPSERRDGDFNTPVSRSRQGGQERFCFQAALLGVEGDT